MVSYVIKDKGRTGIRVRYVAVNNNGGLYPSNFPHRFLSRDLLITWRRVRALSLSRKDPDRFTIERWEDD